ncbi:MAG: type I-C CRISPR-associated protein Cas5c [Candidatus Melainabacteria bacterium]|jgi:CRISPR-associated protein Cas5d
MNPQVFKVKVKAENACFTRPEMKVERVSYDVITPSAARGVLEAIHWKPAIRWVIKQIDILKPIKWESVRRNEVGSKASVPSKKLIETGEGSISTILVDEDRQQRAGLFLKDVSYVIHAYFLMTEKATPEDNPIKHTDQFLRRLRKGQCHHQPYLGCREFSAYFEEATEEDKPSEEASGDYFNRDLGWMLYDIDFKNNMEARFFRAKIENGSIQIPSPEEVGIQL